MRKPYLADLVLLAALLPSPAVSAESRFALQKGVQTETMAQNDAAEQPVPGRDILVAGADAAINGRAPTKVSIDIGSQPLPPRPKLELTLSPSDAAGEAYLVVVDVGNGADAKRLGAVSFYPARRGVAQAFYFDAAPVIAAMKAKGTTRAELSLSLAPVERGQTLTTSEVRLIGARLVEG
jgi:hypothetical protein